MIELGVLSCWHLFYETFEGYLKTNFGFLRFEFLNEFSFENFEGTFF